MRDSFHFQDIYQKYINYYASRYTFFPEATTFNYNYNYQIGSNKSDLNNLLDEFAENLPAYLQKMAGIWLPQNTQRTNAVRLATTSSVKSFASFDTRKKDNEF